MLIREGNEVYQDKKSPGDLLATFNAGCVVLSYTSMDFSEVHQLSVLLREYQKEVSLLSSSL